MSELAEKLVRLLKYQNEFPCNSCRIKNGCKTCKLLKRWLKKAKDD